MVIGTWFKLKLTYSRIERVLFRTDFSRATTAASNEWNSFCCRSSASVVSSVGDTHGSLRRLDHGHVGGREGGGQLSGELLHGVDTARLQLAAHARHHARLAHNRAARVAEAVALGDPELLLERGLVGADAAAAGDQSTDG